MLSLSEDKKSCNNTHSNDSRNHDELSMTYIKQTTSQSMQQHSKKPWYTIHDIHQATDHNPWHTSSKTSQSMQQRTQQCTLHDPNQATVDNPCNNKQRDRTTPWHTSSNKSNPWSATLKKNHCIRKHMHTKQATSVHQWKLFVFNCCSSLSQLILTVFVTAITVLTGLISSIKAVTEQLYNCVK